MVRAFDQQTMYTIHRALGIGMKMTELQGVGRAEPAFLPGVPVAYF